VKPKILLLKLENELSLPIPLVRTILYCHVRIKALKRKSFEPNFITIFFNFLPYWFITIFIITFSFFVSPFHPFHLFLLICSSLYSLYVASFVSSFITLSSITKYFLFSLSHSLSSLNFLPLLLLLNFCLLLNLYQYHHQFLLFISPLLNFLFLHCCPLLNFHF